MANPLLKEPKHVFPTNTEDIDHVCREVFPKTWSEFIACIKSFTATCLSPSQRADFNRAVGDSINSVHKLCTNEDYKTNYLKKAECIKQKAMEEEVCKPYYEKLVTHIQEGSVSTEDLCCAHDSFKTCVIEETKECPCSEGEGAAQCSDPTQSASHFAKVIVDNSLGFLLKQCNSIITPLTACNGYKPKRPRFDSSVGDVDSHVSTADGYFPSGGAATTTKDALATQAAGSDVITPVAGSDVITVAGDERDPAAALHVTNDPRTPKEVSTENEDILFSQQVDTHAASSASVDGGGLENRLANARSSLESWLADSQITDFDEFFRQTFRQQASAQPSTSSAAKVRPINALTSTLMSILLYKLILYCTV